MNITIKRTPTTGIKIYMDGKYITSVSHSINHQRFIKFLKKAANICEKCEEKQKSSGSDYCGNCIDNTEI